MGGAEEATDPPRLHEGELAIDGALARRLVAEQFPAWAHLPLRRVASSGTVHAIYRLGDELALRLPRTATDATGIEKELRWVPRLAPSLPLEVQQPLERGEPADGYPAHWSVWRWLPGETASLERIDEPEAAAVALGGFVAALRRADPAGGPAFGPHNGLRGGPLRQWDEAVRAALTQLRGKVDVAEATAVWDGAVEVPPAPAADHRWIHGDLAAANLVARGGRLVGVIDFGCLGVGDPGCDAQAGWTYLPPEVRGAFRRAAGFDEREWAVGRGWALFTGLVGLPYYERTNPVFADFARRAIDAVLADRA